MSAQRKGRLPALVCGLFVAVILLSTAGLPVKASTDDVGLTTQVSPSGSGSVNVDPPGPYSSGQTVSITAVPASGWELDRWSIESGSSVWWDSKWDYRLPVTVNVGPFARKDKPAEVTVNFTTLLTSLGKSGAFDPNSVRVIEVDADGNVLDGNVPSQFDKATDYNANNKAGGTVVWLLKGDTDANATRRYHIYFDVTGKGFAPPNFPAQVTTTDGVVWPTSDAASQNTRQSIRVVTSNGTYYYHKAGGGFASLLDSGNNDWIGWSSTSGSGGDFRGVPNMLRPTSGGYFHPGRTTATTTLLNQGPLKATFTSTNSNNQQWQVVWEVYPNYARMTVTKTPTGGTYWFLYEGTPGGALDVTTDTATRSDGSSILTSGTWTTDIPNEEWAFFSDPGISRSIYLAQDPDDTFIDGYYNADGKMTVFGFGRNGINMGLSGVGRQLTVGLVDATAFDPVKTVVYNAYKPITVTTGSAQTSPGAAFGKQNPINFQITGQHTVTAYFKQSQLTLDVLIAPNGSGTVVKSPNKAKYNYGEEVTLVAVPNNGFAFNGWQGDLSGLTNPIKFNITKNTAVTANFVAGYQVTKNSNPSIGGSVQLTPDAGVYPAGTEISVQATPNPGYQFLNWSGALSGSTNPSNLIVNSNATVTANFGLIPYTFSATVNGPGGVDWAPKKATYTYGEVVRVVATPDDNAVFDGWSGDRTGSANPLDVTITANTSVTANFHAEGAEYTLDTNVNGPGEIEIDPEKVKYEAGETVELTAVPADGYVFAGWSGSANGTANPTNLVMDGNKSVTATFVEEPTAFTIGIPLILR